MDNLPNEQWRPITGYKGKYLISDQGRVKSLKHLKPRILKAFVNNKGYARVALCKDGKSHHFLVSRLVAQAFCPNPDPEHANTVDHIDGDTLNNTASNLRWMTLTDNVRAYFQKGETDDD